MSNAAHVAEVAVGVVNELARQGGQKLIEHPHGLMAAGASLVQGQLVLRQVPLLLHRRERPLWSLLRQPVQWH